jgi:chromate transporter
VVHAEPGTEPATLGQVAAYFVRLGFTAFGGPAAHIALMEDELVARRRWLSRQRFLDMLAATQLVPGPNSTEMAIHIGYIKAGVAGLAVAGACFVLPAFLIVLALSIAYVAYGTLPAATALLYGIQPVIVAIVVQAIVRLAANAWQARDMRVLGLVATVAALLLPADPVLVIVAGGLIGVALRVGLGRRPLAALLVAPLPVLATPEAPLWQLALLFLKIGATLMGSGYLLISYLENDLVNRLGWLTPRQLIDAIAVGQMTPGPVFTTAAFVGYVVRAGADGNIARGVVGAAVCALAIFLPSFVIVWLIGPLVPRMRASRTLGAFLDGVNAAVVGTMAATTITLLQAAVIGLPQPAYAITLAGFAIDLPALALALLAAALLVRRRAPNSTYLIVAGALAGLALQALAGHLF